ncbi:MAG: hypothetical protein ACYDCL_05580 [Myxococcales bacterium]
MGSGARKDRGRSAALASLLAAGLAIGGLGACTGSGAPSAKPLAAQLAGSRFDVTSAMRAAYEMQLSGEPFALFLGYNLCGFNRTLTLTDQYSSDCKSDYVTDPLGYALAVESFEYSKQPTNNLSFESGAGLSLEFGPILNPTGASGAPAAALLASRFQELAAEAKAGGPANTNLIVAPAPPLNPLNYFGWPGLWPVFAEFDSFDPAIAPVPGRVNSCTFTGSAGSFAYGGASNVGLRIANYECDYNSLNLETACLPNSSGASDPAACRDGKVDKTLTPSALGYAAWNQALLVSTYWKSLQDTAGHPISSVTPGDLPQVGQPNNQVVGAFPDPTDPLRIRTLAGAPGTYLGDTPMEGWQGLTMLDELDNKAQFLLTSLLATGDGALTGTSILAADGYGADSPLLYFPAAVSVTEAPTAVYPIEADLYFPRPAALAISDGRSLLAGLSGLVGGFSAAFALTDRRNPGAGGAVPFLATFDGDPFPEDDGLPDGEATLHDRALGLLEIALVDLTRLHFDPLAQVLVDAAAVSDGGVTRGTSVTTPELAEAIAALRNAERALGGSLAANLDLLPDGQGVAGALDSAPDGGAGDAAGRVATILALIGDEADFLASRLVAQDGAVANGYDLSGRAPDPSPTLLESETGAIRGLLDAYLATSEERYRELAVEVYQDLQRRFWMADIGGFRTTAGVDSPMKFTPLRFGLLSGALRQYYELVASAASRQAEGVQLLAEVKRTYKLVLNGWDDIDHDDEIQYPAECLSGRLEMGERALTGELGHPADHGDRDSDCVREISIVGLPAALGAELDLSRP